MSRMCASKLPFDFSKARGPRSGPDVGKDVTGEIVGGHAAAAAMTVTSLLALIKGTLNEAMPGKITVVGEISNLKMHSSGHLYFSLKDAGACINAAMFRQSASRLKFRPSDGLEVVIEGRVDVYEVRGQLQLYADSMTPKGAGALELAFRQLQEKLQREGLFDAAHKVALPRYPQAVGVITSPTGAAVRDIRRTLARRWPAARVYLLPVLVQGEGAAADIAEAIGLMDTNAGRLGIETMIVGRGGGSLEDLWSFNEEIVARAIYECRTPIISGVGHEVDVTIADLVADVRAATPTAAAELAVPESADVRRQVAQVANRLVRTVGEQTRQARRALESCMRSVVFRDPYHRLRTGAQRVDELSHRLRGAARQMIARDRRRLEPTASRLASLHPARLREAAMRRLEELTNRLRWVLGARSKSAGDALAEVAGRLLAANPRHRVALARQKVEAALRQLESMSYRSVLGRGFSVTRGADGKILRSVGQVQAGQPIETELTDGRFGSIVGAAGQTAAKSPVGPASPGPSGGGAAADAPETPKKTRKNQRRDEDAGPLLFS